MRAQPEQVSSLRMEVLPENSEGPQEQVSRAVGCSGLRLPRQELKAG